MCNWCTYGAADLAGVSRLEYPPNIIPVRVMCSASVSPITFSEPFKTMWTAFWWADDISETVITCMVIT